MYAYINIYSQNIYSQREIKKIKNNNYSLTKKREENEKVYLFDGHGLHPWLLHCL